MFMNSFVAALSRRKVGMCLVKGQLYVRPKYVLPLNFLLFLLLHLIRRSHRNASHFFFAACVERSTPTVFLIAIKTYDLEITH